MKLMEREEILIIDKNEERYLNNPYGGLFGNAAIVQIVEEMISDPFIEYRVKDLQELLDLSPTSITNSLKTLVNIGLIIKEEQDPQRPVYRINTQSKKFRALTLLAFAVNDDHTGSHLMDHEIERCYQEIVKATQYKNYALTLTKNDFYRCSRGVLKAVPYTHAVVATA